MVIIRAVAVNVMMLPKIRHAIANTAKIAIRTIAPNVVLVTLNARLIAFITV